MTITDLFHGESANVEYKLMPPQRSIGYTKTAVAFANGQGGDIVFGVEDGTMRVVGIPANRVFTVMDSISNAIVDSCTPLIVPDISLHDVEGKTVIVAHIPAGAQRPYRIASLGLENGTFVRVAGTTRQADQATIQELILEGENRSFDRTQCPGLTVNDDDIQALCDELTRTAGANARHPDSVKPVTARQLVAWGVLLEKDGGFAPTNAYAILTGNTAVRSVIQCGVFKGDTKAVFVDRREFSGTPQRLVEEAYQYVLRNIHLGARFNGVYRQDVYEIPPDAIRELIVNAVVHRSYIDHSSIQVALYDNRLEITSPGRLPMGQTIDRMKQGYSKIRNEALAEAFAYMGLIEHWGSGILRVMQEVRDAGLPEPEFLGGDVDLRVNIYRAGRYGGEDAAAATDVGIMSGLSRDTGGNVGISEGDVHASAAGAKGDVRPRSFEEQQRALLESIGDNQSVSVFDAATLLDVGERQAQRVLKALCDAGKVTRIGAARSTRYRVSSSAA